MEVESSKETGSASLHQKVRCQFVHSPNLCPYMVVDKQELLDKKPPHCEP